MTNLPNISNNLQSPARGTAKAPQGSSHPEGTGNNPPKVAKLPASRPTEGRNEPSPASGNAANTSQTNNTADAKTGGSKGAGAQPAEPFASLLARQIGETDLLTLDAAQVAIAIKGKISGDGANQITKEAQDPAAITTNTPIDPTNAVAAMLLQLPQEIRTPVTNDAAGNSTTPAMSTDKTTGIDIATLKAASLSYPSIAKPEITKPDISKPDMTKLDISKPDMTKPEIASTTLEKIDVSAIVSDKQIISDALIRDAAKRVDLPASLAQPSPNTTQAITSSAMSAMMPNMLANNSTTGTTLSIATPLGNSAWADDFSQKISWISTQRNQIAELHLNPPDLGPLNVVLKISDNQATALFTSPHSAVRDAVENAMPKLREALAENGIMLGNATVSDQSPRDRSREGLMNQGSDTASPREISETSRSGGLSVAATQTAPIRRHNGMVDTFA